MTVGEGADEELEEYVEAMEALGVPINEVEHEIFGCRGSYSVKIWRRFPLPMIHGVLFLGPLFLWIHLIDHAKYNQIMITW